MAETDELVVAPHGRDDDGVPKAPFGYKDDGNPRKSNRGRRPGEKVAGVAAPPKKATANVKAGSRPKARTKAQTKDQLMELVGMLTTGVAKAADAPPMRKKLGERHATALMGDAIIVEAVMPEVLDGVIMYADRKPGLLAWMDKAEDAAPALLIAKGLATLTTAIVQNHMNPDAQLASAARSMVRVKAARYAAAIEQEAAALGLLDEPEQRAA